MNLVDVGTLHKLGYETLVMRQKCEAGLLHGAHHM